MQRPAEKIEALGNLGATRCPELAKYRKPHDVPMKDPLWSIVKTNDELKAYQRAAKQLKELLAKGEVDDGATSKLEVIKREMRSLEAALHREVLWEKQNQVYAAHLEALKSMPLKDVEPHETYVEG